MVYDHHTSCYNIELHTWLESLSPERPTDNKNAPAAPASATPLDLKINISILKPRLPLLPLLHLLLSMETELSH